MVVFWVSLPLISRSVTSLASETSLKESQSRYQDKNKLEIKSLHILPPHLLQEPLAFFSRGLSLLDPLELDPNQWQKEWIGKYA